MSLIAEDLPIFTLGIDAVDNYSLVALSKTESENFINFLSQFNGVNRYKLLFRGDSFKNADYEKRIADELVMFFVVGQKSLYYINQSSPIYSHVRNHDNKNTVIADIEKLVITCNEIIQEKIDRGEDFYGQIPDWYINYLRNPRVSLASIEKFKILLLSFLHNKGNDSYFKSNSPFISLTYLYDVAKKFATCAKKPDTYNDYLKNRKGVIYFYVHDEQGKYYYTTQKLHDFLMKKLNVKWHKDENKEVMYCGGLYPTNLIGFIELDGDSASRFILNPAFNVFLQDNVGYQDGLVKYDDSRFFEYAARLGYTAYSFQRSGDGAQFVAKLDSYHMQHILESPE